MAHRRSRSPSPMPTRAVTGEGLDYSVSVGPNVKITAIRDSAFPESDGVRGRIPTEPMDYVELALFLAIIAASVAAFVQPSLTTSLLDRIPVECLRLSDHSPSCRAWSVVGALAATFILVLTRTPNYPFVKAPSPADYERFGVGSIRGLDPRKQYVDLVKRSVIDVINQIDDEIPTVRYGSNNAFERTGGNTLDIRIAGEPVAPCSLSMIGWKGLTNIEECIKAAVELNIPGDIMETGSNAGGAMILGRAALEAYDPEGDRRVVLCDVFAFPRIHRRYGLFWFCFWFIAHTILRVAGFIARMLPGTSKVANLVLAGHFPQEDFGTEEQGLSATMLSFPVSQPKRGSTLPVVQENFARFGLLDERVVFLQGYFSDTIPVCDVKALSVLRLDGDTYVSTRTALDAAYDKVSPGGFIIVDDYYSYSSCRRAIDEFRKERGITAKMHRVESTVVFWQKA